MTSRLQSNTVILQRRSEAPKSWLGKQRVAVGGAGGMVRLHIAPVSLSIC
jgi:protein HOOK3